MSDEAVELERAPYAELSFPPPWPNRPYTCMNMVATIDGKTVTGDRSDDVADLGSKIDHEAMRRIQAAVQAVMVGAGSMRATKRMWYPKELLRFVVTSSGKLDAQSRFFTDAPARAFVLCPRTTDVSIPEGAHRLSRGETSLDFPAVLQAIRQEIGVERLLVEGGSELNAQLLALDLVDEAFLTIAPKVKLGRATPTYAGGDPLPRPALKTFRLLSALAVGDEVFLRYRRER